MSGSKDNPQFNRHPEASGLDQQIENFIEAVEGTVSRMLILGLTRLESPEFHEARYSLYDLATRKVPETFLKGALESPVIKSATSRIFDLAAKAGELEELQIGYEFLNSPSPSYKALYERYYGATYEAFLDKEFALLREHGITPQSTAYVGSGALPLPAIILAKKFGLTVTCVEASSDCALLSREIIARLGLCSLISVWCARGETFDFKGFDTLICANWISNRPAVVDKASEAGSIETVILRSARVDTISPIINALVEPACLANSVLVPIGSTVPAEGESLHSILLKRAG